MNKGKVPTDLLQRMVLKGVITGSDHINPKAENGGFFQTYVTVPAPDTLSHPTTYGVNASTPLGPKDQEIEVVCNVRPYNRRGKDGRMFCNNSLWLETGDEKKEDAPY